MCVAHAITSYEFAPAGFAELAFGNDFLGFVWTVEAAPFLADRRELEAVDNFEFRVGRRLRLDHGDEEIARRALRKLERGATISGHRPRAQRFINGERFARFLGRGRREVVVFLWHLCEF